MNLHIENELKNLRKKIRLSTSNMQEVIVDKKEITCSGELGDHPLVYYKIGKEGFVVCGYCSMKFVYKEAKEVLK